MTISKEAYAALCKEAVPKSPLWKDCVWAFLVGGAICTLGQALIRGYTALLGDEQAARTWGSITLIALSALLTVLGLYDRLAKHAGAGTLVPITGFANAVAAPAMEFHTEGLVLGLGAKLFTIAGPVLVYGTAASVLYGLLLCAAQALAKGG